MIRRAQELRRLTAAATTQTGEQGQPGRCQWTKQAELGEAGLQETSWRGTVRGMTAGTRAIRSESGLSVGRDLSRRQFLQVGAVMAGAMALSPNRAAAAALGVVEPDFRIRHGRLKQSIMGWTFNPMPVAELARHCKEIGLVAMEGIDPKYYPTVRELGLNISLVGSHGFTTGPCNPEHHAFCERRLREAIDLAASVGCPNVITFTGMRVPGMPDEEGGRHCVALWKRVIGYAEKKQVNLCLEHLNTRDSTHPMKGHPGYLGDHVDWCVELIRRVGSPRMKLLFDIYHVQIMNGDVIRRLRQYKDLIAHIHTAGVPGRGELDDTQELNYPAIMRTLVELGYAGYVVHEFIPTWPDKVLALRHAAKVCDV